MRLGVVLLDMVEVGGFSKARNLPVQQPHPIVNVGVIMSDHLQIALEMLVVHRIKSDDGSVKSDISFGKMVTKQELVFRGRFIFSKQLFNLVKVGEHIGDFLIVNFLFGGESGLVDPIVDIVINPAVDFVDFLSQGFRVDVYFGVVTGEKLIEFGVQDSDDFTRFVVDDSLEFLIPKHRDSESATVIRVGFEVQFSNTGESVQMVLGTVGNITNTLPGLDFVLGNESPSLFVHVPMNNGQPNERSQSF